MKLYWFQVAPNPTKVRLYIAEKNAGGAAIDFESVVVKLPKGEQNAPEHLGRNPFASLPVLELDDGTCIIESLAIIDYLEEVYPDPPLWGMDAVSRARGRELERIVDIRILANVAQYIHATNSPTGHPPNASVAASAREALPSGLEYIDRALSNGQAFVAGDEPGVADCTLAATLQFARFAEFDVIGDYAHIRRWDVDYRDREAARSVLTL
ncbi:MAG: glutathione S-transferase family protein [Proteobacteria bacterium]|nr:glutathione S-transferase family protein [Pseudomonadota bacterium]